MAGLAGIILALHVFRTADSGEGAELDAIAAVVVAEHPWRAAPASSAAH